MVSVSLALGCESVTHRDYAYSGASLDLEWLSIHGQLRGRQTRINKNETASGSPYELLLWFKADSRKFEECIVTIEEVELTNESSERAVFIESPHSASFKKRGNGYQAGFVFGPLSLDYVDFELIVHYAMGDHCPNYKQSRSLVRLDVVREYKERVITPWNKLMGI